ncbi:DUF4336 domain-containing protein [Pelagibacterium sp. H642]|uniref:DUF4336 domain-containing protein n=1 Tax=Pelagibacterium sp. H642 TaxID=1881069 RepID=UPI002814EDCF|nr:DUF4336 domain-containing protein [Pelagibacterium sp. H642]WMT90937.1 DUF4336 domain-containing protein [Pelagibacterium sp. H642]
MTHDHRTYPPLDTLKPIAQDIWIVDGPIIEFGMPWPKMGFPTRMTVVRLSDGTLFIHSPTPLSAGLKSEIEAEGAPAYVIGPNRIHYWWVPEWHTAYPEAKVYLAPRIREQAGKRITFPTNEITNPSGFPWDAEIATLPISGDFMTEIVFFHRRSRTLILTDLIENFEPEKLSNPLMRLVTRLGGVQAPDGQMPRDMRLTYRRNKTDLRNAVETMISWNPERIVIAHGRWFPADGANELRRAFRWLL